MNQQIDQMELGPILSPLVTYYREPSSSSTRTLGQGCKEWIWKVGEPAMFRILGRRFPDGRTSIVIELVTESSEWIAVYCWDSEKELPLGDGQPQRDFRDHNPWIAEHLAPSPPLSMLIAQWAKEVENGSGE